MANLRGWSFAIVFGTGAVILLTLYVASPFLASRFEVFARPRPAQETVSASATVLVRPSVAYKPPAAYHLSSLRTAVVFSYKTPIDVNDTADISATLSQDDVVELLISAPVAASGAVSDSNVDEGWKPASIELPNWVVRSPYTCKGLDLIGIIETIFCSKRKRRCPSQSIGRRDPRPRETMSLRFRCGT